jgi:hypothetical protein
VLEALDGEVEILDPGRKDLAEYASGLSDAELGFWLRWHCCRSPPVLPDVSAILRASARQSHPVFGRLCRLENA